MEFTVPIHEKSCNINISPSAQRQLAGRHRPLVAEIEITLACCVRQRVNFRDAREGELLFSVTPELSVAVVSAEHEAAVGTGKKLPPIANWKAIVPRWLAIDFSGGDWQGSFGYGALS